MKRVKAFIQPHRLDAVEERWKSIPGLPGLAITRAEGFGVGREGDRRRVLTEKVEIQVVVRDTMAPAVVAAIREAARTGRPGDGKIFVSSIETAGRIRTGEEGEGAL